MHRAVKLFIKETRKELPHKFRNRTVLEIGSKDINGSPRRYFWFCKYTGIDISGGKGVDIVGRFSFFKFTKKYQVIVCTEVLEHDETWRQTLQKMFDLLLPGGMLLVTCAGPDRAIHGTTDTLPEQSPDTNDYYRNLYLEDFRTIIKPYDFEVYCLQYARGMMDLQFYGIKNYEK